MNKYDISLKIEGYRRRGQIDKAIEITKEAIEYYPESNFFIRFWEICLWSKKTM